LTFIHASEQTGILNTLIAGVPMVMAQDFNQHTFNTHNKGGNAIFYYDTDKENDTWYDIYEKVMASILTSKVKSKTPDLFTQ
jgi:hypothetical protein